jgi:hypothetical protein
MYEREETVHHLLGTLRHIYIGKEDWKRSSYVGSNIVHDEGKAS